MASAPLSTGFYRLRSVNTTGPDPGAGGMYATRNGAMEPITAAPARPPFAERQIWHIISNEAGTAHTIVPVGSDSELGFSYREPFPDAPIIFGSPKNFIIYPADAAPGVYIIRPDLKVIGVDVRVGVSDDEVLVLKYLPVVDSPGARQAWQFEIVVD